MLGGGGGYGGRLVVYNFCVCVPLAKIYSSLVFLNTSSVSQCM